MSISKESAARILSAGANLKISGLGKEMHMTDDEAKLEVEEKLRKQQLTKPMTEVELAAFCNAMHRNLEMTSKSALTNIRSWSRDWQDKWFRSNSSR